MQVLEKSIGRLEFIWLIGAAIALFTMMALTVLNVVLRYGFNNPLGWSQELITLYLLPASFFGALSGTLASNEHVKIDMIGSITSNHIKTLLTVCSYMISLVFFAVIAYVSFLFAIQYWINGQTHSGFFQWPTWIMQTLIVLGVGLICIRIAFRLVVLGQALWQKCYDIVEDM